MSIIIASGHQETAEVEFAGRHPDIFSSAVAARLVLRLAEAAGDERIHALRADLNVQSLGGDPIRISIGGQVVLPPGVDLRHHAEQAVHEALEEAGYSRDFPHVLVSTDGVTEQSPNLQATAAQDRFADSCVVYGHHIAGPHGLDGTFPALILAQRVDAAVRECRIPALRPDGKVHVTVRHAATGFVPVSAYVSVSHAPGEEGFAGALRKRISAVFPGGVSINAGGPFDVYFLQADAGVSKAKDDVIVTGGLHQLGTDRLWGKCMYKASSVAVPYAFAVSRAVCDATGAQYACVGVFTRYGQRDADLQLQEIDPAFEHLRPKINKALESLPRSRSSILGALGMPMSLGTYRAFNDPAGFHRPEKPWKRRWDTGTQILRQAL